MTIKQLFVRNSLLITAVMGIGMSAAPARAQDECLLNGNTTGGASAFGAGSLACGANASASTGSYQTVMGSEAVVSGNATTALGYGAFATQTGAIAIGGYDPGSDLQRTRADGTDSVAIGHQTVASAAGSVALGAGSIADQANTVSIGAVGSERRIVNLAAGTLSATSTDAVNGSQLFATNQNVAANTAAIGTLQTGLTTETAARITADTTLQTNIDAEAASRAAADTALQSSLTATNTTVATHTTQINTLNTNVSTLQTAVTGINTSIAGLETDVGTLFDLRRRDRREARRGTAAAVAMSEAPMPARDGGMSYSLHGATYRGQYAVGGSLKYRVNPAIALDVGLSHAGHKDTAARVGISGEF
jgi:trimeric autotransporter adhesin